MQTSDIRTIAKSKTIFPVDKVNKEEAFIMALKGHTYSQIAEHFNVTPQAISKHLTPLRNRIDAYIACKDNIDVLLEEKAVQYIQAVDADVIKKNLNSRGLTDPAIAIDKIRLLRGESTENINVLVASIDELKRRKVEAKPADPVIDVT